MYKIAVMGDKDSIYGFASVDASKTKNIYSANKYPEDKDIANIFKFTDRKSTRLNSSH